MPYTALQDEIFVTKPWLPPKEEVFKLYEGIWESRQLTNCAKLHQIFEEKIKAYLQVPEASLFANGTLALLTALKALNINGEVITTPYSFIATSHSLLWNGLKPVFVDIEPNTLNINPEKIESAINEKTTAILGVHCYGNPCDVAKIDQIAKRYQLKVIYDAAHAFGVRCDCDSLLSHGDISVLSFHATKVFNTAEGGAIICKERSLKEHIDNLKNFGFTSETDVISCGINAKMNEFSAALGIVQLKYIDKLIEMRSQIASKYKAALESINGISIPLAKGLKQHNYSYMPILVGSQFPISRDELYHLMKRNKINCRRYFYPLISEFPMYKSLGAEVVNRLPIAKQASNEILCLPIYPDLPSDTVEKIISIIESPAKVRE